MFDKNGMWADVSSEPPVGFKCWLYNTTKNIYNGNVQGLPVVLFDGDDVVQKESENDGNNNICTTCI